MAQQFDRPCRRSVLFAPSSHSRPADLQVAEYWDIGDRYQHPLRGCLPAALRRAPRYLGMSSRDRCYWPGGSSMSDRSFAYSTNPLSRKRINDGYVLATDEDIRARGTILWTVSARNTLKRWRNGDPGLRIWNHESWHLHIAVYWDS